MHVSQRLLVGVIVVVSLAGCGPTASAPTRTAATAAPLDRAATPLARATALPQSAAPTTGESGGDHAQRLPRQRRASSAFRRVRCGSPLFCAR